MDGAGGGGAQWAPGRGKMVGLTERGSGLSRRTWLLVGCLRGKEGADADWGAVPVWSRPQYIDKLQVSLLD